MTADVATVGSIESVTRLERILETSHNAFPVVDQVHRSTAECSAVLLC